MWHSSADERNLLKNAPAGVVSTDHISAVALKIQSQTSHRITARPSRRVTWSAWKAGLSKPWQVRLMVSSQLARKVPTISHPP